MGSNVERWAGEPGRFDLLQEDGSVAEDELQVRELLRVSGGVDNGGQDGKGGHVRILDVQLNLQEPMGFPSSVLNAHEIKESPEPGPPLDHCFPEEQNVKFSVNYISDYQLHDVFVDGGDREPYVEQMYKIH
jgi:hypothetical protein